MKKINLFFLALLATLFLSISCTNPNSNSNNSDSENQKKKYTVMIYGAGGGNLDLYLLSDMFFMDDFYKTKDASQVNVTIQINFSDEDAAQNVSQQNLESDSEPNETIRGYYKQKEGLIKDTNYKGLKTLHDPDVLTDFIKYSKEKCPADKYILILWNHGEQFSVRDQPVDSEVTKVNGEDISFPRSVIFDNNSGNQNIPLSIFGIEEGIKNSGVKMELIYFYCCLMGQVENLYQLRNQTNYTLSSGNISYTSNLGKFLSELSTFDDIKDAMNQYMLDLMSTWQMIPKEKLQTYLDVTFSDMSKWDNFVTAFIKVKEALIKKYFSEPLTAEKKQELDQKWAPHIEQIKMQGFSEAEIPQERKNGQMYFYDFIRKDGEPLAMMPFSDIDLSSSFKTLAQDDEELTSLVADMEKGLDELLIRAKTYNRPAYLNDLTSLGLVFVDKRRFTKNFGYYQKYDTLESVYTLLDWDKDTKWSDFIKKYDVNF